VNRSMRIQDLYVGAFPRFIRNIPVRCWGGNVYQEEVCISVIVTRVAGVHCRVQ